MNIYSITTDIGDLNEHLKKITSIDLTSYATKEYVDGKIDSIPETDLTPYATKQYVDGKIDSIPEIDLTSYATKQYVDDAIGDIDIPLPDLTTYATKQYVDDAIGDIDIPQPDLTTYATKQYVDDAIGDIDIPQPDLTPYATKQYVDDAIGDIDIPQPDLTPYATKQYVDGKVDGIDLAPYATKQYVDDAIGDIDIPQPDLTNYYTKDEVYNKTQTDEQIEDKITEAISGGEIDLTQYVKKSELNEMSYVSASALNGMSYVSTSALNGMSYVTTSSLNDTLNEKGYVTTSALNDMNFAKATDMNNKQDKLSNANVLSNITSAKVSNWDNAATDSHTHDNKTVLDGIKATDITNWNGKTSNAGTITGITMNGVSKGTSGVVDLGTVITSETDPVFVASAAHDITSADITKWNNKTDNIGTVTGIKVNDDTFNPDNTGIVDITSSYNSLWTSYQALWNQVTYLYAHVVWKSDEGGDEPTPEPTGNIYVGFIDTEDINEIDVANLTDVTTTAVSTKDDKTSDGITFTCNTGTGGYAWVVVPESYNIQYVYDKATAETFGDENAVRIFDYIGTKDDNKYWMAGHNGGGYNDGQTFNIVLLTSL